MMLDLALEEATCLERGLPLMPAAFPVTPEFLAGEESAAFFHEDTGVTLTYEACPEDLGYRITEDWGDRETRSFLVSAFRSAIERYVPAREVRAETGP